jgi:hypothetical protein
MWFDSIKQISDYYHATKDGYKVILNKQGEIITKCYWQFEDTPFHIYQCIWSKPSIYNFIQSSETICHYEFTTNGILYTIGEYMVFDNDDVECLSLKYILIDYDNE